MAFGPATTAAADNNSVGLPDAGYHWRRMRTSSSASRKSLRRVSVALDRYSSSSPLHSGDRSTALPPSSKSVDAMTGRAEIRGRSAGGAG